MEAAAEVDRGGGKGRFMWRPACEGNGRDRFVWRPTCGGSVEVDLRGSQRGVEAVRRIGVEVVRGDCES